MAVNSLIMSDYDMYDMSDYEYHMHIKIPPFVLHDLQKDLDRFKVNRFKESELQYAISTYCDFLTDNYLQASLQSKRGETIPGLSEVFYDDRGGRTYIKILRKHSKTSVSSVHSFIVKEQVITKDGKQFNVGDILMASSWSQPSLNAARGNILIPDYKQCTWNGTGYLK